MKAADSVNNLTLRFFRRQKFGNKRKLTLTVERKTRFIVDPSGVNVGEKTSKVRADKEFSGSFPKDLELRAV